MTKLPGFIMREVFGHEPTRALLLHLERSGRPIGYTEIRENLDQHPEAFHRGVKRLEHHGLLGRRAADRESNSTGRSYRIYLELTGLGRFYAELWYEFEKRAESLAREHHLPSAADVEV